MAELKNGLPGWPKASGHSIFWHAISFNHHSISAEFLGPDLWIYLVPLLDTCFGRRAHHWANRYVQVIRFGAEHGVKWCAMPAMLETSTDSWDLQPDSWTGAGFKVHFQLHWCHRIKQYSEFRFAKCCGLKHLKHFAMWTVQDYGPMSRSLHWWVQTEPPEFVHFFSLEFWLIWGIFVSRLPLRSVCFHAESNSAPKLNPQVWRSTSGRASLLAALEALRPAQGTSCDQRREKTIIYSEAFAWSSSWSILIMIYIYIFIYISLYRQNEFLFLVE